MKVATRLSSQLSFGPQWRRLALSRRDYRTQPGVLTPGADQRTFRPEGAVELVLRLYAELSRANHGSKIYYTPSGRVVMWAYSPGLKPRAESYYPFGICSTNPYWTVCVGPNPDANRQRPDQERQSK